uniref:OTU domain-containing protein n=1 Tax=Angiostrongylus cantonensis TaxID=6313 RepID=A0A0K0CV52_ANGCA
MRKQKKTPLVGDRVPFEVVVMEYDPVESSEYYTKAKFYKWMGPIWSRQVGSKSIFQDLNDDNEANYLIIFLRLITAGYLKEHSEEYAPFIEDISLSDYCASEIESMWKDADHLAVTGQSIRVQYMDQNAAPNGGLYYDFPPDQKEVPRITLLYRPGHYDLIYRR